jgi:hypothetical protein
MEERHTSLVLLEQLDHLARCQRCRIRAMTLDMLLELVFEAYEAKGLSVVPGDMPAHRDQTSG